MRDGVFIQKMLQNGNDAREKAKASFNQLSLAQLDWKPAEESWSIGQCLDHLIVSDCSYFPALKRIAEGKFKMSYWERWSPFSSLFGKILTSQIQDLPKKKLKAPLIFYPSPHTIDAVILERFYKHFDTLLEYIVSFSKVDIDKIHITSPALKFVTYSLRRAIVLIIQHEHRHINQAIAVTQLKGFPPQ